MNQAATMNPVKGVREALLSRLLVAYDSSAASETALQYAVSLAKCFHSFLTVVYVQTPSEIADEMENGFGQTQLSHKRLSLDLESVAQRLRDAGVENRVLHRAGAVGDILIQLAAESQTDLLLLGAHGSKNIDLQRLGSTAEFMLRSMPCAVLTIGPGAVLRQKNAPVMQTLLFASSLPNKLRKALHFLQALGNDSNAKIEVFHAIDDESEPRDARTHNQLRDAIEALANHLQQEGLDVTWTMSHGELSQLIVERANTIQADLILFGIEHPPLDPNAMGKIGATIQQASCPVLTVPGPA